MKQDMTADSSKILVRRFQFMLAVFLFSILVGCSTTVRDHNTTFSNLAELEGVPKLDEIKVKMKDRSAKELLAMGQRYLAKRDFKLARVHFIVALQKDPELIEAYTGLGETLLHFTAAHQARNAYAQALELDPDNLSALVGLARICRQQKKNDIAKEYLDKALEVNKDNPVILTELAVTYDAMGYMDLAQPLYEKVRDQRKYKAFAHNNLGFNYMLQGKYDRAVKAFEEALALRPNSSKSLNNLATAYALAGREAEAIGVMESVLGKAEAYNNLGYIYITQSKWEQAEKALQTAIDLQPFYYKRAKENLALLERKRKEIKQETRDSVSQVSIFEQ